MTNAADGRYIDKLLSRLKPKQVFWVQAAREGGLEPPQLPREADWVESGEMCRELQESGEYGMLVSTEHMARIFIGWRPPAPHQACFTGTHFSNGH